MSLTIQCELDAGDDIGEAIRAMVAAADRLQIGLHASMNGVLVVVVPGDSAEVLLDHWVSVRGSGGDVVRGSIAKARMS